ncbi:hypothetical protein D4764_01G0003840 [Takifugu flavidus]|uniref:Uncharacterized protein n=1 Tax=Takifugu flavidus TaxID=433684 RepID=A0A5C6PNN7_9TELE|nr:hypothetical protein D4764_01G0003840 [Takifugu flavidus]
MLISNDFAFWLRCETATAKVFGSQLRLVDQPRSRCSEMVGAVRCEGLLDSVIGEGQATPDEVHEGRSHLTFGEIWLEGPDGEDTVIMFFRRGQKSSLQSPSHHLLGASSQLLQPVSTMIKVLNNFFSCDTAFAFILCLSTKADPVVNHTERVRSSAIREELRVEPLLLRVERSQMRWLGHLVRMPPGRLPGEVFWACPSGRRPPGRPRTRWRDYVSRLVWERLGIPPDELEEEAGEREVWASLLRLLPPRPDPG